MCISPARGGGGGGELQTLPQTNTPFPEHNMLCKFGLFMPNCKLHADLIRAVPASDIWICIRPHLPLICSVLKLAVPVAKQEKLADPI